MKLGRLYLGIFWKEFSRLQAVLCAFLTWSEILGVYPVLIQRKKSRKREKRKRQKGREMERRKRHSKRTDKSENKSACRGGRKGGW